MSELQQIRIQNFKAIQDSGPLRLTPLTVLVGNNGSGKSSLIEALEMLQSIVEDGLDQALRRWRDFEHIWNKGRPHDLKYPRLSRKRSERLRPYQTNGMAFSLKGRRDGASWTAEVEVNQEPAGNEIYIRREYLNWRGRLRVDRDASGRAESGPPGEPEVRLHQYADGESAFYRDFPGFFGNWQFLSLNPDAMGSPTPRRRSGGRVRLARDGSNAAEYLLEIRDIDFVAFEGILEALQYVLPYARDLQPTITQEIERSVYFQLTEQTFKLPGWVLSTGTLRLVALLAVLRHPDPPKLLVVEELENGLDPRTLHLIVEEIRRVVEAGTMQVIVTTHSPYLLDLLDLSHIVLVERVDGRPMFTRPGDQKALELWSRDFAPGQLYTMGRLSREVPA